MDALPGGVPVFVPVRFPLLGADGVVAGRRDADMDVILDTGLSRTVYIGVQTEPVEDPDRQIDILRAVSRALTAREAQARQATIGQAAAHAGVLSRIREYAIDRCRAGEICQDGLSDFLSEFGMDPDQLLVRFTITGSYRVSNGDRSAARTDAASYLRVDLSQVDDADEDSLQIDVSIDSVGNDE